MFRGGLTKPDQGAEGSRKPRQSPQAQRAYNQMRDVEEEFKRPGHFREALQQRERGRQNGISYSPYLEIPSSHIRRHRSRTGSIGSTGPASTQGSDGGVEDSGRKRRGHRTKPLEEPQRLRTAFIRTYVGACRECRTRKVKCTHFDDTELEANYQASKHNSVTNDLIWECKRGAVDPWAVAPTDSESFPCHARFPNHNSFLEHYRTQHEPFVNEKIGKASETDCWALHRLSDPTLPDLTLMYPTLTDPTLTVSTATAMPAL
ncbi:hypothetical protein NCU10570 [Neurospora crassa OR74A]|uniref:Uncharacterized protein n=1 Tax=Neurospora crassa (strain ATCC 24698 / 74-OR23-1A / CBS 708.71 / DSM 1257 / FGSC 987) TaxID=367110 RepID=A7UVY6_NEUCR|nr:hypothetical protein NCU10570 [Neurospora crassa OR74A]EDO65458.2 hypothetical protein NCU10570 [Neurospora crassa OR74A]|eukprot:XP_001728549.2 hypothetical protein NCU10570 [Neurospora crassa OR74A]